MVFVVFGTDTFFPQTVVCTIDDDQDHDDDDGSGGAAAAATWSRPTPEEGVRVRVGVVPPTPAPSRQDPSKGFKAKTNTTSCRGVMMTESWWGCGGCGVPRGCRPGGPDALCSLSSPGVRRPPMRPHCEPPS